MELSIYSQFKVNIENLVRNKVIVCKNFNIQPSELERMPYWEYEMTLKECEKIAEEEKKQHDENQGGAESYTRYRKQADGMMKGSGAPKMPGMPRLNTPRIPTPRF